MLHFTEQAIQVLFCTNMESISFAIIVWLILFRAEQNQDHNRKSVLLLQARMLSEFGQFGQWPRAHAHKETRTITQADPRILSVNTVL